MKKNLSILLCSLFFVQKIYSDPATQVANLVQVLRTINQTQNTTAKKLNHASIQFDFNQLIKPYKTPAINKEIETTRNHINNAAETLLQIANKKITNVTAENFLITHIQPCYVQILNKSMYSSPFSKTPKFQIPSHLLATKELEYQMYDILNRIFVLWVLYNDIFNISDDQKIELEWPNAQLSALQWKQLTKEATNILWTSLNPSEKPTDGSHIFESINPKNETEDTVSKSSTSPVKVTQELHKKTEFLDVKPSNEQLEQVNKIFASFEKFLSSQKLTHEIFIKYDFNENLGLAITYLKLIQQKFENDEKLPEHTLLQEIKMLEKHFSQQMNTIYSNYFKKDFAGHFGNEFLVIKHKFAPKANGSIVPELSDSEAVALLTDLIVLWEIYQTLFPAKTIKLAYFNQKYNSQRWMTETSNAGFTMPEQFSEELQKSVTECLPMQPEIHLGKMQLSNAVQKIKAGITSTGSAIKVKAQITGSAVKETAQAAGGWFSSAWKSFKNYVTRHVEEEIDEL
jgi:hypothetical protein